MYHRPICISIGGFDPTGGAGVVADCKVFEKHKALGFSILTANTIQTEDSFSKIDWIETKQIIHQLNNLLERYPVQYFKIGLIKDAVTLAAILDQLANCAKKRTVIWDPILKASAGGAWDMNRFEALIPSHPLLDFWITPNSEEYELLRKQINLDQFKVYLKGGHSANLGYDRLIVKKNEFTFRPKHTNLKEKHGSGCVFSASLLANLSLGRKDIASCLRAKRYIEKFLGSSDQLLGFH